MDKPGCIEGTLDLEFEDGHNTFWAPEVVYRDGEYHMFVAYIRGVRSHWGGDKQIVHYTSRNLWDWKCVGPLKLSSNSVIDATVYQKPDGRWRMWYKDEAAGSHTLMAESKNLHDWSASKVVIDGDAHEGPKVFRFRGYFWMLTDEWKGLRIYRSKDLDKWEKQGLILGEASSRPEDTPSGAHADVVVTNHRAYIFISRIRDEPVITRRLWVKTAFCHTTYAVRLSKWLSWFSKTAH